MISELPARATTQAEIDRVKSHMERIEMEGKKYTAIMEVNCCAMWKSFKAWGDSLNEI